MKTKQSLKIYELLNKELEEPEKARIMTDAIERIIEEKRSMGQFIAQSSFAKELEWLRKRLTQTLHMEMSRQKTSLLFWMASLLGIVTLIIIWLYHQR